MRQKNNRIFLLLLVIVFIGVILYVNKWAPTLHGGCLDYYTYSKIVLEGNDFSRTYDTTFYRQKVIEYTAQHDIGFPNQLPTNALTMVPFTGFSYVTAKVLWVIFSLVLLLLGMMLIIKEHNIKLSHPLGIMIIILSFMMRPTTKSIADGQIYFLLLFLFAISLYGINKSKLLYISIPLSMALVLKGWGAIILLWMLFNKMWKPLFLTIAFTAIGFVVTLPLFGIQSWIEYYNHVVRTLGTNPTDASVVYQNINSFLFHLFSYDAQWLPHPLVILPKAFVLGMSYTLNLLLMLLLTKSSGRLNNYQKNLSFSAVIAASVITAPVAAEYTFVLFLPLMVGLFPILLEEYDSAKRFKLWHIIFILSVMVIVAPIRYNQLQYADGLIVLLAYPKFYAGAAMLSCFLFVRKKTYGILSGLVV